MRWENQLGGREDEQALPGLRAPGQWRRTVRTPEFAGITFHEVLAKSALNRVPDGARIPMRWTINPYRGCSHGCVYCFARRTHSYLELDTGHDFDSQIVVKTNLAEVLRRELARPSWQREHVALGTNTDPYQRADGRYQLMPQIIDALRDASTPFSVLTKGTVLMRDLDALAAAGTEVPVSLAVSLALLDADLQETLEPGTPTPSARLRMIRAIRDAGLPCGVLVAPVLPYLTDSTPALRAVVRAVAGAGATSVTGMPLRLMAGAREWYLAWLQRERPDLVEPYRRLYRRGANADPDYRTELSRRIQEVLAATPLRPGPRNHWPRRSQQPATSAPADDQPRLF